MKKHLKPLVFIVLFSVLLGCKKEDSKPNSAYSWFIQLELTKVTNQGADFLIKNPVQGSKPIQDFGLVWSEINDPSIFCEERVSFGTGFDPNGSSCSITSAISKDKKYNVRAYFVVDGLTVFSNLVNFIGQGCSGPKLINFEPKLGTWGDTLTITGEGFSTQSFRNEVKFGDASCSIVETPTNKKIRVLVPDLLKQTSSKLSLKIYENTVSLDSILKLKRPEIIAIEPKVAKSADLITIKGKNFGTQLKNVLVKFGDQEIVPKTVYHQSIQVGVPPTVKRGNALISVKILDQADTADYPIYIDRPEITSISPEECTWGDTVTIKGHGFSAKLNENQVVISNQKFDVLKADTNYVRFVVPKEYESEDLSLKLVMSGNESKPFTLHLKKPEITGFNKLTGGIYDIYTIYVKNLYSDYSKNLIEATDLNGVVVNFNVINSTKDSIQIKYSNDGTIKAGLLNVRLRTFNQISEVKQIEIKRPEIISLEKTEGKYGERIMVKCRYIDFQNLAIKSTDGTGISSLHTVQEEGEIFVYLSPNRNSLHIKIFIEMAGCKSNEVPFSFLQPEITYISTKIGYIGQQVKIVGKNLSKYISGNHVYLRDANGKETELYIDNRFEESDTLKFSIWSYSDQLDQTLYVANGSINSKEVPFRLIRPEIIGFSPSIASIGSNLTLYTKNAGAYEIILANSDGTIHKLYSNFYSRDSVRFTLDGVTDLSNAVSIYLQAGGILSNTVRVEIDKPILLSKSIKAESYGDASFLLSSSNLGWGAKSMMIDGKIFNSSNYDGNTLNIKINQPINDGNYIGELNISKAQYNFNIQIYNCWSSISDFTSVFKRNGENDFQNSTSYYFSNLNTDNYKTEIYEVNKVNNSSQLLTTINYTDKCFYLNNQLYKIESYSTTTAYGYKISKINRATNTWDIVCYTPFLAYSKVFEFNGKLYFLSIDNHYLHTFNFNTLKFELQNFPYREFYNMTVFRNYLYYTASDNSGIKVYRFDATTSTEVEICNSGYWYSTIKVDENNLYTCYPDKIEQFNFQTMKKYVRSVPSFSNSFIEGAEDLLIVSNGIVYRWDPYHFPLE